MPRPASETETPVGAGFGPTSSIPAVQLGNYADLNVQGAPSQAAMLAKSLGVVNDEEQNTLARDARMRGAADEGQGAAAAALGNIDPTLAAINTGYAVGAQRVSAQKSAIDAITQIRQQMASDPKLSALSPQDAVQAQDNMLRTKLAGLDTDPISAKAIGQIVLSAHEQLLTQRMEQQITTDRQTGISNATTLAAAQASLPPGSTPVFNYSDQLSTMKGLNGGNVVTAKAQLDQALIDTAVAQHQTGILGLIQAAPGEPGLAPDLQLKISEAQKRIQLLQQSDNEAWNKQAQNPIMSSILKGQDPTAQLQTYLAHPGADSRFAQEAMGFYHSLSTDQANDQLDSGRAAQVTADILSGKTTSAQQLLQAGQDAGVTGKALQQLLRNGLSTLSEVQRTNEDDPSMRAGLSYLQQYYRPETGPLGQLTNSAQLVQQNSAVLQYRQDYQKALKQGMSADEAMTTTLTAVQQKFGKPMQSAATTTALPKTDAERASYLRNSSNVNPAGLSVAGINPSTIKSLRDSNQIDADTASAALRAYLAGTQGTHQ
jgi:hypothetical protein